jgi:hypothetical protein
MIHQTNTTNLKNSVASRGYNHNYKTNATDEENLATL